MPHYQVRLRIPGESGVGWSTRVEVQPFEQLTDRELQRRARRQAVAAFGRQARGWTLIDAVRKRG